MMPPLVPIACAVAAGVLLAAVTAWPAAWFFALGAAALAALTLIERFSDTARQSARVRAGLLALLWVGVGGLRMVIETGSREAAAASLGIDRPRHVVAHGIVVNDPAEPFDPGEPRRVVCVVDVLHLRADGRWQPVRGRLRARVASAQPSLRYGDELLLDGELAPLRPPSNPGQFDWRASLARQRIDGLLSVRPQDACVRIGRDRGAWALRATCRWRARWETLIDRALSPSRAGLLRSLLLGERVALDEPLKRAFIETGTIHLLVISGFNVGLIAWLLERALRLSGFSLAPRLAMCAAGLAGFCLLTGMQAPVVRATVMADVVLLGLWLDRVVNWPNALAVAALAILGWNPQQLFDPGFQLSFGAVASLLALTKPLQSAIEPCCSPLPAFARRVVAPSLATTGAVTIGLWPLLTWYFHLIAPVSIVANLLLVPLTSAVVGAGTVVLTLGLLCEPVVRLSSGVLSLLLDAVVVAVSWCHRVPGGCWSVGQPAWPVVAGYYALLALSLSRRRLGLTTGRVAVLWLAGLNAGLWGGVAADAIAARRCEITALDVGHGDSLVLRSPAHQTLVVDTGTDEAARFVLLPFLRARGWTTIDALILTHPDDDHVGGAVTLLRALRVRRLFTNGALAKRPAGRRILEEANARRVAADRLVAGQQLRGLAGVAAVVLHPPPGFVPGTAPSTNDNSLVMKVAYGASSMLLTGDLEERGLPWCLAWQDRLASTVLKVPHHGSALGPAGRMFVERVHPAMAIISVGTLHHLPTAASLRDLRASGAEIVLTRDAGAVTIRLDGRHAFLRTFRDGRWAPVPAPAGGLP